MMADHYVVECGCGQKLDVQLFEAGTSKECPSCRAVVPVPSSTKLKESAGDPYPLLRPIEKIQRAIDEAEPPFDGPCHACRSTLAEYVVPIVFDILEERHVSDGGGIRPTITGGIKLAAGATDEVWQATTIPLMLCDSCHARFQRAQTWARRMAATKSLVLFALLGAFLYFAYYNFEVVAAFSGILWLIGAVAWAIGLRQSRKFPAFLIPWIERIRWVPDAIAAEDEFALTVGAAQRIGSRRSG